MKLTQKIAQSMMLGVLGCMLLSPANAEQILASNALLTSMGKSLVSDTKLTVTSAIPDNLPFSRQQSYLNGQGATAFAELAKASDSVIGFRSVRSDEPVYPYARRYNIRLVEIDALNPIDGESAGISVVQESYAGELAKQLGLDHDRVENNFAWLSLNNLGRTVEIIATDLKKLYPQEAATIDRNISEIQHQLLTINSRASTLFASLDNPVLVSLSDRFGNFSNDLGLETLATVPLDDRDWTAQRLNILTNWLKQQNVKVVIHHRRPNAAIVQAIEQAGAHLVILDSLETGEIFISQRLNDNIDKLKNAFEQ